MYMFLLALLLVLEGGKLHDSETKGHHEPTEDNSQGRGSDVLPGQLIGEVIEVLQLRKPLLKSYNVSHTVDVVVTKSVRHEELSGIEEDGVVLHGLNESRDVATAERSNTGSRES